MKSISLFSRLSLASLLLLPVATFAQGTRNACEKPDNIGELFELAICLLSDYVVPFLFGLALVLFLVGIVKYVKSGDNEEAREAGRGLMLFGIIALFVMTAVWGLVKILYATIFPGQSFELPSLPPQSASPFK